MIFMSKKLLCFQKTTKWGGYLLAALLLCIIPLGANATIKAQTAKVAQTLEQKISLTIKNSSIESILVAICKGSDLKYITDSGVVLDKSNNHSIDVKQVSIKSALETLFKSTNYDFVAVNGSILITNREIEPIAAEQQEPQKIAVSGKVVDSKGQPIAGATVLVDGTNDGAITDSDGQFAFNAAIGDVVTVTFVGYLDQQITINSAYLTITLEIDALLVEDVVVTGIVNRKTSTYTGSATTLKADDLKRVSSSNVFASLKVLDPSLMILDNLEAGSDPNATMDMRLRGTGSFDTSSEVSSMKGTYTSNPNSPLFILDGFETTVETIMDLDVERVESLTILKDATAKALYGARAANGVIVIQTRVNNSTGVRVSYKLDIDVEAPDLSSYDLMNAEEKLDWELKMGEFDNNGFGDTFYEMKKQLIASGVNTDWMALPLRNAVSNKHRLDFELGGQQLRVIAGLTFNNNNGVMQGSNRNTLAGDFKIAYRSKNNKLAVANSTNITYNKSNNSNFGEYSEYVRMNPYYPAYDKFGLPYKNTYNIGLSDPSAGDMLWGYVANPLWDSTVGNIDTESYTNIINNINVDYWFSDALKATIRFGLDYKLTSADEFYSPNDTMFDRYTEDRLDEMGWYTKNQGNAINFAGDAQVSYNKVLNDKHIITFTAQGSIAQQDASEYWITATGFPSDMASNIIFSSRYMLNGKPEGYDSIRRTISGLATGSYSYADKYLFDFSLRSDGSSDYGENDRWGTFWATGFGYNIHEEDFFKVNAINKLKFRYSMGTTGATSPVQYGGMYVYNYYIDKLYQGQFGLVLNNLPNFDLSWQEKFDRTIGFDLAAFDNKLNLTFDYYWATTRNSVINQSIAPSHGFSTISENVGEILNEGWDIRASYRVWNQTSTRSFVSVFANVSHNTNTIIELSDAMSAYNKQVDEIYNQTGEDQRSDSRPLPKYYEGASMDAIWAMASAGIDPMNGREIFIDRAGNATYEYDPAEQQELGNSLPLFYGSAGIQAEYKGFGLNIALSYRYGGQLYNYTLAERVEAYDIKYNVDRRVIEGAWTPENPDAKYRAANEFRQVINTYVDPSGQEHQLGSGNAFYYPPSLPTERFIMDDNRIDINSVSLSYDFWRHDFVKKLGLENLKFTLYGENLLTISSTKVERGTAYPFSRVFKASLAVTF